MDCRKGCGACCIAPDISSPVPGMPDGKPAGVRCANLTADNLCGIFNSLDRPKVCAGLKSDYEMCGGNFIHAMEYLKRLETETRPGSKVK
jgi:Fe-S-cluster containining protein